MKVSPHPLSGCAISRESGAAVRGALVEFLDESDAHGALLIDETGAVLYRAGDEPESAVEEFGALAAGALAAISEMAGRLGAEEFEGFHFQGGRRQFFIRQAGGRFFLCAVFGERTNLGIVRACGFRFAAVLQDLDFSPPPSAPIEPSRFLMESGTVGEGAFPSPLSFEAASRDERCREV